MIRQILTSALIALPAASFAQTVEVAEGNWAGIPYVQQAKDIRMTNASMDKIDKLITKNKCRQFGRGNHIRMDVPILLKFTGDGAVEKVVIQRLNCTDLEGVVGGVVASRAQQGYYKPTGQNATGWYRSAFTYASN